MNTYITKIDGKWYAFAGDTRKAEVYSIGADSPRTGGQWFARWSESGIKYVASPSTSRSGAYKKASRHVEYCHDV
ncbi:MAG: hypothetical protein J6Y20_13025 [Lachnospiraceae bacterium]|nr:hypothetical protein [Lachnospiraceae bacterium]